MKRKNKIITRCAIRSKNGNVKTLCLFTTKELALQWIHPKDLEDGCEVIKVRVVIPQNL